MTIFFLARLKFVLPTVAVLLTSTLLPPQLHAAPAKTSDEKISQDLVLRLLKCPSDCLKDMKLLIGQLPQSLSHEILLPKDAKVVATLIRNSMRTEIVLDAPQSPEQIRAFYQTQLIAKGWKPQSVFDYARQPGFVATEPFLSSPLTMCKGSEDPEIEISATRNSGDAMTDVRLYVEKNSERCSSVNQQDAIAKSDERYSIFPIPRLNAPVNVQAREVGWSISGDRAFATANLETTLSGEALHAAYAEQLNQAGWKKRSTQKDGTTILSRWTFTDKEKQLREGLLIFTTNVNNPKQFSGVVMVLKQ